MRIKYGCRTRSWFTLLTCYPALCMFALAALRILQLAVVLLDLQMPSTVLYVVVNVWTLTGQCRLHGALIDWFR